MQISPILIFIFFSHVGFSQSYELKRDKIKLLTLYYVEDSLSVQYGHSYSYVEYQGNLYNASPYLESRNDGCINYSLRSIDNKCTFKIFSRYLKLKVTPNQYGAKIGFKKFYAYKCVAIDGVFFFQPCKTSNDLNPYYSELGVVPDVVIHFVNIVSDDLKLTLADLPVKVTEFLSRDRR